MYQAKTLREAVAPLEVVHQRPGEVAAQRRAGLDRLVRRREMRSQVGFTTAVRHPFGLTALRRPHLVLERRAVFGHDQRSHLVLFVQPQQHLGQPRRIHLPPHRRVLTRHPHVRRLQEFALPVGPHHLPRVVVHP